MKRLRILIPVLVVLAALYLIVSLSERRGGGPDPLFPELSGAAAAGIYIYVEGRTVALVKKDSLWIVPGEDSLAADPAGVGAILDKVASFSRSDKVSSNPGKRSVYQVDSTGILVSIVDDRGDTTAAFVVARSAPTIRAPT